MRVVCSANDWADLVPPFKPAGVGQQPLQLEERNVHAVVAHGRGAIIAFQAGVDDGGTSLVVPSIRELSAVCSRLNATCA